MTWYGMFPRGMNEPRHHNKFTTAENYFSFRGRIGDAIRSNRRAETNSGDVRFRVGGVHSLFADYINSAVSLRI